MKSKRKCKVIENVHTNFTLTVNGKDAISIARKKHRRHGNNERTCVKCSIDKNML